MLPEITDLLEKLKAERQELLDAFSSLSDEQAQQHPGGEWSAKQQAAHMVEGEPEWLGWAMSAYTTPGTTIGHSTDVEQPFLKYVGDADSKTLQYWIEQLQLVRAETLRRISQMDTDSPEAFQRKAVHRTWGELTVLQFLRGIYRHDRMHHDQVLGREQSFTPRRGQ